MSETFWRAVYHGMMAMWVVAAALSVTMLLLKLAEWFGK